MDPALAAGLASAVGVLLVYLVGLVWAHRIGAQAGAEQLAEREARHVAERALDARLLAEERGRVEALAAEVATLRASAAHRAAGGAADLVALDRLDAPGPGGDADAGLLSAFPAPPATGDRAHAPATGPAPARGPVVPAGPV